MIERLRRILTIVLLKESSHEEHTIQRLYETYQKRKE